MQDQMVELLGMQRSSQPGYTPFQDAPEQPEEEAVVPISIPAGELQRLTSNSQSERPLVEEARASVINGITRFIWHGGSPGDAWLHMTAAQVCSHACMTHTL